MFFIFLLTAIIPITLCDHTVTLHTKLGSITGLKSSVAINNETKTLSVYKRIPFAKPPTGKLRFQNPVPHGRWRNTLDATEYGPSCIQQLWPEVELFVPNLNQSEDCLHLNIYSPADASPSNKKSVMVWIHGGGYVVGQAMMYDGSYLSVVGDVIVVTINYRLGIFGFLSTSDGSVGGNYGLYDQQLAIRWVKQNIDSFGGDVNSITIFGESAGGFSVGLQAINPDNKGLFSRAIAQSGTANSLFAIDYQHHFSDNAVRKLNCSKEVTSDVIACLQHKLASDIYNASNGEMPVSQDLHMTATFAPVIDGRFLKVDPMNIISHQNSVEFDFFKSLDVIIGNCEAEGSLLPGEITTVKQFLTFNASEGIPSEYMCKHLLTPISEDFFNNNSAFIKSLCTKYSDRGSIQEQGQKVIDFFGDLFMYLPAVQSLNAHASNNRVSKQFQYMSKRSSLFTESSWYKGSGHASELAFLFPMKADTNKTQDDVSFSIIMMKYWSNFAKTGDVNGPGLIHWPVYDLTTKQYALLDLNVTIENNLYKDRLDFMSHQLMTVMQHQSPSPKPCTNAACGFG